MSSSNFCGLTPQIFCRKLSRLQVPRALAWKRVHKSRQEIRRTTSSAASPKNANKNKKEIRRTASQVSSAVLSKSINSMKRAASSLSAKNQKLLKTPENEEGSPKCTPNFILMVELRKNILTFRDMIDLPVLDASLSVTEIVMQTMKDLQKLSSEIVTINKSLDMENAEMDTMFIFFYEDLRAIGDSWIMDRDWIERSKYKHSGVGNNKSDRLVEHVLAALDGLIKMLRERFDLMELEYDGKKDFYPKGASQVRSLTRSESFSDSTNSFFTSPITPTTVLPGMMSSNSASPTLWNLRAQALEKLSPADVKRLALHILSQRDEHTLLDLDLKNGVIYEGDSSEEAEKQEEEEEDEDEEEEEEDDFAHETEHEIESDDQNKVKTSETSDSCEANLDLAVAGTSETTHELQEQALSSSSMVSVTPLSSPPSSPPPLSLLTKSSPPQPPPLPPPLSLLTKRCTQPPQPPPPPLKMLTEKSTPPPPQPPPLPPTNRAPALSPPPQPQPQPTPTSIAPSLPSPSPPPPPPPPRNGDSDPMKPPPPPPPGSPAAARTLRAKKAASRLRRSAQIANLYWVLKGKLEGRGVEGKRSKAKKDAAKDTGAGGGGKTGMADALAEMTKRSAYFQQIEEDVRKYTKSINELKPVIQGFETTDMKELLEFHCKVESVLEKLTDETQILARFEGFPQKKLEAIRTAGALYKKLDGILNELKNWKVEPPLTELLDKIERYFGKVKGEIEALERTKDDDAKMFQSHKIHLGFDILVQIKESMVDVSSNCMELALKERREANEAQNEDESSRRPGVTKKPEEAKRLWRAFQFAFKVYTFAGGHDDRADHLTRQLAHEIQTDPQTDSNIKS